MSSSKLVLSGAAGALGGAEALNVEDVFSTYLYKGTASTLSINNGIDLSGEGGLVWVKNRDRSLRDHALFDTERGVGYVLHSNTTDANDTYTASSNDLSSFNSDGFTLKGNDAADTNGTDNYASWTFRKAEKFFDVVTYTGTGSAQTISHNLGSVPGCIIVKSTSAGADWGVYHRGLNGGVNPEDYRIYLNLTSAEADVHTFWNDTPPTSTEFTVNTSGVVNDNGVSYVAYLFAHNDDDGEFGPDGDADIIKCGSYTGNGSTDGPEIDLGFEPQWLMIKEASNANSWFIIDAMRGIPSNHDDNTLRANTSDAEGQSIGDGVRLTPTGFKIENSSPGTNRNNSTYIYIAIRRGPMAVPEDADDVFDIATRDGTEPHFNSNFDTVDFALYRSNISASNDWYVATRLTTNKVLRTNSNAAEIDGGTGFVMDFSGGWYGNSSANSNSYSWMWRRAPKYFGVVAYKGNGLDTGHNISHNLGAVPEMIWVKNRETASQDWYVYHKNIGNTHYLRLNATSASVDSADAWNDTTPTDSVFTVGGAGDVNWNNANHIAYLFASLDGVSKVGSFSHTNNTTTSVDCGFSNGARFVMIKLSDGADSWYVWDTTRGINAGTEPLLRLNTNGAEITTNDWIDPLSSGFQITGSDLLTGTYIFYAIA